MTAHKTLTAILGGLAGAVLLPLIMVVLVRYAYPVAAHAFDCASLGLYLMMDWGMRTFGFLWWTSALIGFVWGIGWALHNYIEPPTGRDDWSGER